MRHLFRNASLARRTQWALVFLAVVTCIGLRLIGPDGAAWRAVINDDGKCYYEYLRALFITHDLGHEGTTAWYLSEADDGQVIKCFSGTAVMQLPFFLAAHLRSLFPHGPEDGYSLHYQLAIALAGLFYFWIGLRATRRLLEHLGLASSAIAIALVIIMLGTGLFYYAVWAPAMSHVYGFATVALFLRAVQRISSSSVRDLSQLAVLFALVILVRPVNGLVLLAIPLFRPINFREVLRIPMRRVALAGLAGAAVLAIQPAWWYLQSGHAWVQAYGSEGFIWNRPRLWSTLFGARRGLFFYWPLLLLVIPGLIRMGRHAWAGWIHLAALAYFTSAWWAWYYGAYGMRPYVDHLAVLAVPIAWSFNAMRPRLKGVLLIPIGALIALQCFQSWQYAVGLINSGDMDLEKYKRVFLRTDPSLRFAFGGAKYEPPVARWGYDTLFAGPVDPPVPLVLGPREHLDIPVPLRATASALHGQLFVELSLERREETAHASRNAVIHTLLGEGTAYPVREQFLLNGSPDAGAGWRHWRYAYGMPPAHGRALLIRITNPDDGRSELRNVTVRVITPKQPDDPRR